MSISSQVDQYLDGFGWNIRGGFYFEKSEPFYQQGFRTLLLVGSLGGRYWMYFLKEKREQSSNPLDNWTTTKLSPLTQKFNCKILYPFQGPPYHPFVTWAKRAEGLQQSPMGILVHPVYGLWHSYRAALLWSNAIDLPPSAIRPHPCDTCKEKPCLNACPISAIREKKGLDFQACRNYLKTDDARACYQQCCQARRSCIVGPQYGYSERQSIYHTRRFSGLKAKP